jgi:hypothetical protein
VFENRQRAEQSKWLAEKAFLEKKLAEKAKAGSNGSDQVKGLSVELENERPAKSHLETELTKEQMHVAKLEKKGTETGL